MLMQPDFVRPDTYFKEKSEHFSQMDCPGESRKYLAVYSEY